MISSPSSIRLLAAALLLLRFPAFSQQITGQDIDTILTRADALLNESKAAYEEARTKNLVAAFVDAGFKLEEARIKYLVLQEIGQGDKQKIAAERLRAVNQLSKLIHDGKVAITGKPADAPASNPAVPRPADADPTPAPEKVPLVDVTRRAAVPEATKQNDAEKQIKEIFKDQYARKTSADRKGFARELLDNGAKSQQDPAAAWVFFRESQEMAIQACDVRLMNEAIDAAARMFDVDALAMKNTALAAAARTAKSPEEATAVVLALLKLIDDLVAVDQYDAAEKAGIAAVANARKSNDPTIHTRASTRAKEVAESKALFQGMKNVLETLAKNPADPPSNLETGRFICFVKGNWDLGLRFLVKGSDPSLKTLAEKELGNPTDAVEIATLGEGWLVLADKEKSALRKSQLTTHAHALLGAALRDAPPLLRARIEKKLNEQYPVEEPSVTGLVGRWFFNEGSGTKAEDSSGNANHGTLHGGMHWVPGVAASGIAFDGTSGWVSLGVAGLPAGNAPQTVSWAQLLQGAEKSQIVVAFAEEPTGLALTVACRDGKLLLDKWGNTRLVEMDCPPPNQWRYFAYVYDGKSHKLYVDGFLKDTSTVPASQGTPKRFELGRWGGNNGFGPDRYYSGILDDLRVYSRVLTDAEIRGLIRKKKQ